MTLAHEEPLATIYRGDCVAVMAELPEASVDAIVCDPPYGLEFMGKEWDRLGATVEEFREAVEDGRVNYHGKGNAPFGGGGQRVRYGASAASMQTWHEAWALAALRVLKPGGHLVAFGGTRTFHRLTCALEDAGFEIRDCLMWLYGSGFPKSKNVGNGWGTALKPAWEPIILARKPLAERSVAANVLAHGTGALNVDGCRIHSPGSEGKPYTVKRLKPGATLEKTGGAWRSADGKAQPWEAGREYQGETKDGRWPANLVLDEAAAALLDEQSGERPSPTGNSSKVGAGLAGTKTFAIRPRVLQPGYGDTGGASRYFYTAKADADDRDGSKHPTVKPVDLMKWLIRLVTPPEGVVLDPFLGSGTTVYAARALGVRSIGIEREADYVADAVRRLRQGVLL